MIRITIKRDKDVVHSIECEVSAEGEIETAVGQAMAEARKKPEFGPGWGFTIHVDKA